MQNVCVFRFLRLLERWFSFQLHFPTNFQRLDAFLWIRNGVHMYEMRLCAVCCRRLSVKEWEIPGREGDRKNTIEMKTKKIAQMERHIFTIHTKSRGKTSDGNFSGKFSDTLHNFRFEFHVFSSSSASSFPFDFYTWNCVVHSIPFGSDRFHLAELWCEDENVFLWV